MKKQEFSAFDAADYLEDEADIVATSRYVAGWPDHTNAGRLTQRQISVRIRDTAARV